MIPRARKMQELALTVGEKVLKKKILTAAKEGRWRIQLWAYEVYMPALQETLRDLGYKVSEDRGQWTISWAPN